MTIKQQIKHRAIQKVCHLHNGIFHPIPLVTLCQFYFPFCFSLNFTKKLWNERKGFLHICCLNVSLYIKDVENHIFKHNWIFRPLCMYKQLTLTKQIKYIFVQILYSYFRYTSRLFLGCALFVARCKIIRASCETKKEILRFRENIEKNLCEGQKLFYCTPSFLCNSLLPSLSTLFPFPSGILAQWPVWMVLCDDIMSEWLKIWKSLAILF